MKKLASKITAVLVAAGLMFPAGTIGNIDFGLTAFAEENTAEGYTNGFCDKYELKEDGSWGLIDENDNCTHTGCNGYQPATLNGSNYEIGNAGQLYWFADKVNNENATYGSANAILTDNITINENVLVGGELNSANESSFRKWTPIGNCDIVYTGTFDGNDKTISGVYYSENTETWWLFAGLFGNSDGSISNIIIKDSYFSLTNTGTDSYSCFGALVGGNGGTIKNCQNYSVVEFNGRSCCLGGLCGNNVAGGSISECTNYGKITAVCSGESYIGGVSGTNFYKIENCNNAGSVTDSYNSTSNNIYVGGISGTNYAEIKGCHNSGTVDGGSYIGGVCGGQIKYSYGKYGTITNCYNTGTVKGTSGVGGICGWNIYAGTIENCYSAGSVSGTSDVGGVCGYNNTSDDISDQTKKSTIRNCYYDKSQYGGEAIGYNSDDAIFEKVEGKTLADFSEGEVCYLLNNGETNGTQVWYQTINSDSYPLLDNSHGTVYASKPCPINFSNTDNLAEEEHNYTANDDYTVHTCTKCGETHNAEFTADDTADTISICHGFGTVTLKAPPTENLTYDGTEKAATVEGELTGFDTPKILYKEKDSSEEAVETAPVNAGTYVASITYTDADSNKHSVSVEYTIEKAELTVEAGTYKVSKGYDGTKNAGTGSGEFEVNGLVAGDSVTINADSIGAYSSAEVGESNVDVEISLTDASGNYTLKNTTVSVPAEITPQSIDPKCLVVGTYTYTGSPIIPEVIVKQTGGGLGGVQPKVYEKDKDYTITVTDNINVGTGKVTFKPVSGGNYTFDEQTAYFTIDKATPTITADPTAKTGLVYKGTAQELISAGSTNFGTLLYSLDDTIYSEDIPTATDAGSYTVYYKVQGNSNVNDSAAQTVSASIGKASVTVTAKDYIVKFGNPLPAKLEYETTDLIGTDTLESIGANVTIGYVNAVTPSAIGNYTIVVSGEATTTNYELTYENGKLTIIEKPAQIITAADIKLSYGDTGKKIGAATSGGGAISYAVKTGNDVISVAEDGTITALKAGTATVEITAAETDDYAVATKTVSVTVNKKKVAVPTADSTEYTYNGKAQTYGVTSTDDYTVTGGTQTDAGNYPITITLNNENFEWDGVLGTYTFVIKKAAVTITANSYTVKVGNTLPKFDYKVSGLMNNEALPITVTVSCTAADSKTAGEYPISVSGAADSTNYTFNYVDGTLTITLKDIQTITAADVTLTYGDAGKKISATTNGDGTISYSVKTGADVITLAADGTITTLKAGTATVEITAAETDAYEQATTTVTVTVNKAAVTIKADDKTVYQNAALPTFTYSVTGLANGDKLSFTPVLTCEATTTSTVGTYAITVTIEITEDECYTYTTTNGTLTVKKKSSGGGGGGGYRPTTPTEPNNPSIGGSAKSWSDVAADLGKLTNGSETTIELNGNTTIPADVIKAIADKDSKVTFVINSVFSWVIDGAEITTPVAIDLTLIKTASTKSDTLRGIEGTQFKINGTNIPTDLMIAFKKEHEGKFANLYKVVDGKLVFVTCAKLGEDGKVILPDVVEKGDYVAMLCEFSDRLGDMDNDGVMNAKDAAAILKDIVEIEPGKNPLMADFNGDGKVNAMDAAAILKRIVGLA